MTQLTYFYCSCQISQYFSVLTLYFSVVMLNALEAFLCLNPPLYKFSVSKPVKKGVPSLHTRGYIC